MRILHLTSNDGRTGGAAAVERLHRHLLTGGHESLVGHAGRPYGYVGEVEFGRGLLGRAADKAWQLASESQGGSSLWRPSWRGRGRAAVALRPDVIHVHWTYGASGISLRWLRDVSRRIPIVWTMHDMWLLTGGCTNSQACDRWRSGCGECPQIAGEGGMVDTVGIRRDVTAALWRRKRDALALMGPTIVAPSQWMVDRALVSLAFDDVRLVRNLVDTAVFRPGDRGAARRALGIDNNALVVLFVGKPGDAMAYRGRHPVMIEALNALREKLDPSVREHLTLLVVGAGGDSLARELAGVRLVAPGRVESESQMARCFAAADVFLDTTQYDNLPAVVQESLACGVPVVASDVGGIPEIVRPGETGLLAERTDAAAFADHLHALLTDSALREAMGREATATALRDFEPALVVANILGAYDDALSRCGARG